MNLTEFNQSDRCAHFSCPERSVSPAVYILLYVCSAAVVLLTVFGNLLIIISVIHFKQLHTPTNKLMLSLAVSDFFVGALLMPSMLIWTIESCWNFERVFCTGLWLIAGVFMVISIYNIALIALDRYLALLNPFFYANRVTRRTTSTIVYSNWCVCLAYNISLYYFNGSFTEASIMCHGECFLVLNKVLSVIDLIVSFIFPLSVIIILYTQVFLIAEKHATAIRNHNNHTRSHITSHSTKSERKAAKVLGILVFVFLMCLFPYFFYSLLGDVIEQQLESFQKCSILLFLNSTINPIIYALFYPWFRRCFKLILTLQIFQADSTFMNVVS